MSEILIYIALPDYLAQWYAEECRQHHLQDQATYTPAIYHYPDPVQPIRGSQESDIMRLFLRKQPTLTPPPPPEGANLAICLPYYRSTDPRDKSFLPPVAVEQLKACIRTRFSIELWQDLHTFKNVLNRQDKIIEAWMESHGIEYNDTNWNAIAKIYQRKRNAYYQQKCRKKRTTS